MNYRGQVERKRSDGSDKVFVLIAWYEDGKRQTKEIKLSDKLLKDPQKVKQIRKGGHYEFETKCNFQEVKFEGMKGPKRYNNDLVEDFKVLEV